MKTVTVPEAIRYWFRAGNRNTPEIVARIVAEVRGQGLRAVLRWTKKLDGADIQEVEVSRREIRAAQDRVPADLRKALALAKRRIKRFAKAQRRSVRSFELSGHGERLAQRVTAVERAGAYVPGGRFPLMSTALMTVIPAKVAGVKSVCVCTPPRSDGTVAPEVLYAATEAGADAIYKVGGAQAIAAMAYGAGPVEAVDVLVGPGNRYVAAAKRLVASDVRIDAIAGPSELLVIADGSADAGMIARELAAQAEHDPDARMALISTSAALIKSVSVQSGVALKVRSLRAAADLSNRLAPEHLSLQVRDPGSVEPLLTNFGSLFVGPYAKVALGDYVAGPNHTLPTSGTARSRGGLSIFDFLKIQTVQSFDRPGFERLADFAGRLARAEGLAAHERSLVLPEPE